MSIYTLLVDDYKSIKNITPVARGYQKRYAKMTEEEDDNEADPQKKNMYVDADVCT